MKSKEWDGSGLPPIGAVCEYCRSEGDVWRECVIVSHHVAYVVVVDEFGFSAVFLHYGLFRHIKTPEQIAKEERRAAIKEMFEVARGRRGFQDILEILYDAGYRRSEVKK